MTCDCGAHHAGDLFRRIVIRAILSERGNPEEFRARVYIARSHGHLTADEAHQMLADNAMEPV